MAYEGGWMPAVLYTLTGLTALGIQQKTSQEKLELVLYIIQHPASAQETKDLAAHLHFEFEAKHPKEEIEVAQLHAGSKSLDEIVRQFLASG
jgi:hypothetical protein